MIKIENIHQQLETSVAKALSDYKFQPELTKKLDQITDFTEVNLLEVVLWKTNRYPQFDATLLSDLNLLRKNPDQARAKVVLRRMLNLRGFDLPMASTVMRFIRPDKFQIIDQRVYRFIMPGISQMKIPYNKEAKLEYYFQYLDKLREVCLKFNLDFTQSDRIFYQLDKLHNSTIPIKY